MSEPNPSTQAIEPTNTSDQLNPGLDLIEPNATEAVEMQVEKISDRKRQITAQLHIPHSVEQVWQVLTNYEALADFIPNLAQSRRLDRPNGGIRLEQVGSQRFLKLNFSARVVLDLEESFPQAINFCMVEGDFKEFSGSWNLKPCSIEATEGTHLCYTVQILPKAMMPISIIERRLSQDLQTNLLAVQQRVAQLASI